MLALLRRPEGATVAQVAEATGWAVHTVRGFLAGLNKAGTSVTVLERVRQVEGGQADAKAVSRTLCGVGGHDAGADSGPDRAPALARDRAAAGAGCVDAGGLGPGAYGTGCSDAA